MAHQVSYKGWNPSLRVSIGVSTCLGHLKLTYGAYTHFFFERRASPPFEILSVSRQFRFPTVLHAAGAKTGRRDRMVQFALSLRRGRRDAEAAAAHNVSEGTPRRAAAVAPEEGQRGLRHVRHSPEHDIEVDFSAADQLSLTARIPIWRFCEFTRWCNVSQPVETSERWVLLLYK